MGAAALLVPDELLSPAHDPVGFRLLKTMGWKEGQGVGPKKKKAVSEEEGEGGEGGAFPGSADFKYAPKDVEAFVVDPKKDQHGLGFDPHAKTPGFGKLLQGLATAGVGGGGREGGGRVMLGGHGGGGGGSGAFGLGMDDLDGGGQEEGDDVFGGGGKGGYDMEMGGGEEEDEEDEETMMERARQPVKSKAAGGKAGKGRKNEAGPSGWGRAGARTRCNDGRLPIKGFVLGFDKSLVCTPP